MDYRVNEVGALIFKPKEENKPTIEEIIDKMKKLEDRVSFLENEIKELKGKDNWYVRLSF